MTKETLEDAFGAAFLFIICVMAILSLTGCGHNIVNYSDGVGFETTLRPDSGNFGITFRYGKILSVAVRENSEVEMEGEGSGDGEASGGASASGSVKIKVGRQITGYYVDARKAGATAEELDKYTSPVQ